MIKQDGYTKAIREADIREEDMSKIFRVEARSGASRIGIKSGLHLQEEEKDKSRGLGWTNKMGLLCMNKDPNKLVATTIVVFADQDGGFDQWLLIWRDKD